VFSIVGLLVAAPLLAALIGASLLRSWARDLPDVPDLAAWREGAPRSSQILAADGSVLADLPFRDGVAVGHRELVPLDRLPLPLIEAVLATEDVRFFQHRGVDYTAIARAAYLDYRAGRVVEGASTITQQLARNLLPDDIGAARNVRRKVREILLARELERHFTKREILETYLDYVFVGEGAYGMAAAAHAYFDRDVATLDLAQSALLAGLIQAPGRLDPFHHPDAARARRTEVLARMARAHWIDEPTRAAAAAAPLALHRPHRTYGARVPWYTEQARRLVAKLLPDGALTVETAALPALGTELQAAAAEHAARWDDAQVAAIVWDHRTGYVEAVIGGRRWDPDRFDRALQSCRQPGSAFKPFVYGAALASGAITPGTALRDAPISEYDEATGVHWKPRSGEKFRGVVLAEDAFAASLNSPAIDVFDRAGAHDVVAFARRLGITTPLVESRPLALGASCVKPVELARAYAAIARGGWAVAPRFVVRVARGAQTIFDAAVPEDPWLDPARRFDRLAATAGADPAARVAADGGRLVDAPTAYQLQELMSAVVERGTAAAAGLDRPAAGKTGTTNDNTDAWFVGFTARTLAAVWVGHDNPAQKLGAKGDGAHAALPLWVRAVRMAEGSRPAQPVMGPPPAGMERVAIDRESGLRAAPGAGGLAVWFRAGTAPAETAGQPGTAPTDFGRAASEF
jgi:penicillin-binding protein 1A